ncbi:hypothetical protein QZH41_015600 [Actinostola sp. cb2023]|nr:hypothetical protein QZH41_015600 [Actinostola sp. cb2023]
MISYSCVMATAGQDHLNIVVFLQNNSLYYRVHDLVERVCQAGNHLTIFSEQMVPIMEYPIETSISTPYLKPEEYLQRTIPEADALLLLTSDNFCHNIPSQVRCVMNHQHVNQSYYSWNTDGITCLLIGGSVHSRKVAINLRHLLDHSDYPFVGRVLPDPCSLGRCYDVDPSCETEEPFVL